MKEKIAHFLGICKHHNKMTTTSLLTIGLLTAPIAYKSTGQIWIVIYIAAILIPIILGMMDKVKFKWVLLWEGVLFLPLTLVAMLFFGGFLLTLFRKA